MKDFFEIYDRLKKTAIPEVILLGLIGLLIYIEWQMKPIIKFFTFLSKIFSALTKRFITPYLPNISSFIEHAKEDDEIEKFFTEKLNELSADRIYRLKIHDVFRETLNWKQWCFSISHEAFSENTVSSKQAFQYVPIGVLNGLAQQVFDDGFIAMITEDEDYKDELIAYKNRNAISKYPKLYNEALRQGMKVQLLYCIKHGDFPTVLYGIDFTYLPSVDKIDSCMQELVKIANYVSYIIKRGNDV